jgi:hypothetical protein
VTYFFIVSKARAPSGAVLVLGSRTQTQTLRVVTLDELDLAEQAQMFTRRPPDPANARVFGLQNRRYGTWIRRIRDPNAPSRMGRIPWLALSPNDPWMPYGKASSWEDDRVPGPYNALVSIEDWEQKINIMGDGPYGTHSTVIMWDWSGGAVNELWRFWPATGVPGVGSRVLLTNFEHIVQLGATPERTVYMHANKDTWETWTIEDAGGGAVYLRSAHGTYLGSRENGEVYLVPHRDAWERWILTTNDGVRFRSAQWGKHLGSRPDGSIYTHVNRLAWERWWATHV